MALVAKQPRTLAEIVRLAEISEMTARRYLKALSAEGVVGVVSTTRPPGGHGSRTKVWGWTL